MENVSFLMAFAAGMLAFFSPCIFPLIPAYISYLTGVSFGEYSSGNFSEPVKRHIRLITTLHALYFVLGFTIVFALLGATATFLGSFFVQHKAVLKKLGGVLIIILALVITGVLKVPFLQKEKRLSYKKKGATYLGSFLVGATFAMAWTPCVGPILGSILVYASSASSVKTGIKLLITFSIGLGLPFMLSALLINSFLAYAKKIEKYIRVITIITGVVFLVFGILLLTGKVI